MMFPSMEIIHTKVLHPWLWVGCRIKVVKVTKMLLAFTVAKKAILKSIVSNGSVKMEAMVAQVVLLPVVGSCITWT